MIPTDLVEVDVVASWRDGLPGAIPVLEGADGPDLTEAAEAFGLDADVLRAVGASSAAGAVQPFAPAGGAVGWSVGAGAGSGADWRGAGAGLARAVRDRLVEGGDPGSELGDLGDAPEIDYLQVRLPAGVLPESVDALVLGLSLGAYRFRVTAEPSPARLRKVLLVAPEGADQAALRERAGRARVLASATSLARDLANAPSNVKDPDWLTSRAAELAERTPGLDAVVRDEKWLTEHGFGGVLAVGGGSARPPRLLELSYGPADARGGHLVLVGKGITFDTGGISLKPADGMHLMRTDMAGGAAVIGALLAIAHLQLPVRVTGLVPAAENHVSGSAYRPGDVVRHRGGTTTEVANTDAEGRMVLADALAYAAETLDPELVVDVATLTGAMKVALGLRTGGVFASEPELAERIRTAGASTGERWWEMPLLADHEPDVRGEQADLKQAPSGPGAVGAALFLREFTAGLPWAHLDIAGPARAEQDYAEVVSGATGFAARTLVELAADLARAE
ncbi:peptidase M17 [Saccharopolyspora sp. HNM0983]|uniref:Probable cytosol aminopeptidase n=1 Tax=Saccharopolyspora montiporae TaxID=2781240 RepID=A0A929BC72_9PSEU|nr:peptidase M17 [Saccharopolyspora sp. HNM0983]